MRRPNSRGKVSPTEAATACRDYAANIGVERLIAIIRSDSENRASQRVAQESASRSCKPSFGRAVRSASTQPASPHRFGRFTLDRRHPSVSGWSALRWRRGRRKLLGRPRGHAAGPIRVTRSRSIPIRPTTCGSCSPRGERAGLGPRPGARRRIELKLAVAAFAPSGRPRTATGGRR